MSNRRPQDNKHPWEILVIAAMLFFPGLYMLLQNEPMIAIPQQNRATRIYVIEALSPTGAKMFGSITMFVSFLVAGIYIYLCIDARRRK